MVPNGPGSRPRITPGRPGATTLSATIRIRSRARSPGRMRVSWRFRRCCAGRQGSLPCRWSSWCGVHLL